MAIVQEGLLRSRLFYVCTPTRRSEQELSDHALLTRFVVPAIESRSAVGLGSVDDARRYF